MKNVFKVFYIVAFSTTICTLSSCFTNKTSTVETNSKSNTNLHLHKWKLVDDNEIVNGLKKEPLYLKFDTSEYKVSGFAGCNFFDSSIEKNNNLITFSAIKKTEINCPNSNKEKDFFNLLNQVDRFEIKGNELLLYKGKLLLLQFVQ